MRTMITFSSFNVRRWTNGACGMQATAQVLSVRPQCCKAAMDVGHTCSGVISAADATPKTAGEETSLSSRWITGLFVTWAVHRS